MCQVGRISETGRSGATGLGGRGDRWYPRLRPLPAGHAVHPRIEGGHDYNDGSDGAVERHRFLGRSAH